MIDWFSGWFSDETLKVIDALGSWVSGIGTLGAVIISLYLAREAGRIKYRASVGIRRIVQQGNPNRPEYITVHVTNIGSKPIRVTNFSWKWGVFRRKYALQMFRTGISADPPVNLEEGQEHTFFIPIQYQDRDWFTEWRKSFENGFWQKWEIASLRGVVHTSVGQDVVVVPEKEVYRRIRAAVLDA